MYCYNPRGSTRVWCFDKGKCQQPTELQPTLPCYRCRNNCPQLEQAQQELLLLPFAEEKMRRWREEPLQVHTLRQVPYVHELIASLWSSEYKSSWLAGICIGALYWSSEQACWAIWRGEGVLAICDRFIVNDDSAELEDGHMKELE